MKLNVEVNASEGQMPSKHPPPVFNSIPVDPPRWDPWIMIAEKVPPQTENPPNAVGNFGGKS